MHYFRDVGGHGTKGKRLGITCQKNIIKIEKKLPERVKNGTLKSDEPEFLVFAKLVRREDSKFL
jgi:hypothetical protein